MLKQVVACKQPRTSRQTSVPQHGGFHIRMAYAPHGRTPRQQDGTPDGIG
jgi:hypothetical protein